MRGGREGVKKKEHDNLIRVKEDRDNATGGGIFQRPKRVLARGGRVGSKFGRS